MNLCVVMGDKDGSLEYLGCIGEEMGERDSC